MSKHNRGPYLERNKFGVWEIRWTENRRSRCRSTGEQNLENAQLILGAFLLGKERLAGKQDEVLVREILGDPAEATGVSYWHSHVLKKVVAQETAKYAITHLLQHFGAIEVAVLSQADVDRYLVKRTAGTIGKPAGDATIRRELGVLVAGINWGIKKAKKLDKSMEFTPDKPRDSDPTDRWLTHEEADALYAAAAGSPRLLRFLRIALNTASRGGAIKQLQRKHMNFDARMIRFDLITGPKTKKRRVAVAMSDELFEELRDFRGADPDDYALGHPGAIKSAFRTACRKAGLVDVTPHTLRHTWATWKLQDGWDIWNVAGVLGDTVATVERVYGHHSPEHSRAIVNSPRNTPRNAQNSGLKSTNNDQQRTSRTAENG